MVIKMRVDGMIGIWRLRDSPSLDCFSSQVRDAHVGVSNKHLKPRLTLLFQA